MRYWADLTYGGTIENPSLLFRKKGTGDLVEAYSPRTKKWIPDEHWDKKLFTGDNISWKEITENEANEIIKKWE